MNAYSFIKVTILKRISSYRFRASLAHNQVARNCKEQLLNLFCTYPSETPHYVIFT